MIAERESLTKDLLPDADKRLCHILAYQGATLTLCGMAAPDRPGEKLHSGDIVDDRCTGCGKVMCKTCAILEGWA